MVRGTGELAELGQAALRELRGPVARGFRRRLAAWRDPRARLLRQRRRARRVLLGSTVATGAFGGGAYAAAASELPGETDVLLELSSFGLGGLAVVTGVAAVGTGRRLFRLNRTPLPEPEPEAPDLPPNDSQAHEPMRRLASAESSMHEALERLRGRSNEEPGVAPADSVADARSTATEAAAALRAVADRLIAVEAAREHAPTDEHEALDADVRRLRKDLDEGLEGYGRLVAAAGRAVAAGSDGDSAGRDASLQDATDKLAGLSVALRELQQSQVSEFPPGAQPTRQHRDEDPA